MQNPVQICLNFFRAALPTPLNKNLHTQLGVHFEEVREMLLELTARAPDTAQFISDASDSLHVLAEHLKQHDNVITVLTSDRLNMVDALCDQMVTAIGTAHCLNMDISGAFDEVNSSNLSKFDENGEPIFDANRKVMKGPNYRKADLAPFV